MDTDSDQTITIPFWKVTCAALIDFALIVAIGALFLMVWQKFDLPTFRGRRFIVIAMLLLSQKVIHSIYGTTPGNAILRIKPTEKQIDHAIWCLIGILFVGILIVEFSLKFFG